MNTDDIIKIELKRRRTHSNGTMTDDLVEAVAIAIDRRIGELAARIAQLEYK